MARRSAVAAAIVVLLSVLLLPAGRAAAGARGASVSSLSLLGPSVSLLSQTPWVETHGMFQLHVGLAGALPADHLQVTVFDQLITRTAFEQAANGQVKDYAFYQPDVAVPALTADPHGGFDLDLPVNQAAPTGDQFPRVDISESSGVFPVQVQLLDQTGSPAGRPLTTFLIFSQGTAKSQGYTPLSVGLVVPYTSTPALGDKQQLEPPGASEANRLESVATGLSASNVPATVVASPITLQALQTGAATGSATDRSALAALASVPSGGQDQIAPSPYSQVSLGDLSDYLPDEIEPQLTAGRQTLQGVFSVDPGDQLWVVDGPVNASTVSVLLAHHATKLIVPDADLTPLSQEIDTTFTHASSLGFGGSTLSVYAADAELSGDFTRSGSPVLAANILLADMAMVFTESPGEAHARGMVAMPPAEWSVSPQFLQTVLAGLDHNPLVSATTATNLFAQAGFPLGTRFLSNPAPTPGPAAASLSIAAGQIGAARQAINDMAQILPSQSSELADVRAELLIAETETLTAAERQSVLDSISKVTAVVARAVTLPPNTSFTLTSTEGQLPITILTTGNLHPRVELRLKSQRLTFRSFQPADGSCQIPSEGVEVCTLTLKNQNTTVQVPVETRSSGVFPLDVALYAPGGSELAGSSRQYTVRSTAVSGVAIVIIVVGLLGLAVWWVRDLRRGRRPKGMAPAPATEEEVTEFDEFFNQDPPSVGGDGMSPSAAMGGPIDLRDETRD